MRTANKINDVFSLLDRSIKYLPFWSHSIVPIVRPAFVKVRFALHLDKVPHNLVHFFRSKKENTVSEREREYRCVRLLALLAGATSGIFMRIFNYDVA
jgi:hypothetical protein